METIRSGVLMLSVIIPNNFVVLQSQNGLSQVLPPSLDWLGDYCHMTVREAKAQEDSGPG